MARLALPRPRAALLLVCCVAAPIAIAAQGLIPAAQVQAQADTQRASSTFLTSSRPGLLTSMIVTAAQGGTASNKDELGAERCVWNPADDVCRANGALILARIDVSNVTDEIARGWLRRQGADAVCGNIDTEGACNARGAINPDFTCMWDGDNENCYAFTPEDGQLNACPGSIAAQYEACWATYDQPSCAGLESQGCVWFNAMPYILSDDGAAQDTAGQGAAAQDSGGQDAAGQDAAGQDAAANPSSPPAAAAKPRAAAPPAAAAPAAAQSKTASATPAAADEAVGRRRMLRRRLQQAAGPSDSGGSPYAVELCMHRDQQAVVLKDKSKGLERVLDQLTSLDPAFAGDCWAVRAKRRLRPLCDGFQTRKNCTTSFPTCRWAPISDANDEEVDGICKLTGAGQIIALVGDPDGSIARDARGCNEQSGTFEGRCESGVVMPVSMARFEALANGTFATAPYGLEQKGTKRGKDDAATSSGTARVRSAAGGALAAAAAVLLAVLLA